MKRISEITICSILTIVLLSAVSAFNNIKNDSPLSSLSPIVDDTTNMISLLKVDSFKLKILPPSSGIQFFKDKIVFLSMSKNEKKMSPNQISFGTVEAYYASDGDSIPGIHMVFSPLSSFSYPCEAMTFSRDFNTVYFSKLAQKDNKTKIYTAKFVSDSKNQPSLVEDMIPLEFCTGNFNYSHPALSSDDNLLIFASDIEGSLGGMDLFISRRTGEKWSSPEDLGKQINTTGNEFFPFLDLENNLYFSSDKIPGFGGYDIFRCKFNGTGWDSPINLTDRINSDKDDIAFTINKTDGKTAFFSRREKTGKGDIQLFRVTLKYDGSEQNKLTISYALNGAPVLKSVILAAKTNTVVKPVIEEPVKTKHEPIERSTENKHVAIDAPKPTQVEQKDVVTYRLQLLPNASQKIAKEMVINGTSYKLFEYQYLRTNRYTIGEFSTLAAAGALQKICRQSGYAQSFVVAFKNNTRSLDPNLFK